MHRLSGMRRIVCSHRAGGQLNRGTAIDAGARHEPHSVDPGLGRYLAALLGDREHAALPPGRPSGPLTSYDRREYVRHGSPGWSPPAIAAPDAVLPPWECRCLAGPIRSDRWAADSMPRAITVAG